MFEVVHAPPQGIARIANVGSIFGRGIFVALAGFVLFVAVTGKLYFGLAHAHFQLLAGLTIVAKLHNSIVVTIKCGANQSSIYNSIR